MKLSFKSAGERGGSKNLRWSVLEQASERDIYIIYMIHYIIYIYIIYIHINMFKLLQVCGMWVTCWVGVKMKYST